MKSDRGYRQIQQICIDSNISHRDVMELLQLFRSDEPEDYILEQVEQYPLEARNFVTRLILGNLLDSSPK